MANCRTFSAVCWRTFSAVRPCGRALGLLGLLALWSLGCNKSAPTTPSSPERTATGMTAPEVLERMLAAYRQADRYSDRASYVLETVRRAEGVKRDTLLFEFSLAWERPNKIRFHYQRMVPASQQEVSFDVASNGRVVRSIAGELPQQVHETIAPDKLTPENFIPDPYIRETVLQVSLENIYPQLLMLLTSREGESVFSADSNPRLLGQQKLRGFDCHRVVLEDPTGQRILWIDVDNNVLRRMELPVAAQLSALDPHKEFSH